MASKLHNLLHNDIGIDLGTANTLVYLRGHGIIANEPSIVAVNQKTGRVVAVGGEAKAMLGRTPAHIKAIRPLVDGVISDFEVTEEMLAYFIRKAEKVSKKLLRPRVVVGVPSNITNVEHRAVLDAARSAGAGMVAIVEEPMAAAIGMRLPVHDPIGTMVVDIGGGTVDIAVIALGGVVRSRNLKVAGDRLNSDIMNYLRDTHQLLVGEKTAELVKISVGNAVTYEASEYAVKGRDMITGLPREVVVTDTNIRDALLPSVRKLVDGIREVLEATPPEIVSDVMQSGVGLVGGGALLMGLSETIHQVLGIPVYIADDPLTAVARGTGVILEDFAKYQDILIKDNAVPNKAAKRS